jgi:hypothetical protein
MTTPELDHLDALRAAVIVAVLRPASPQTAVSAADAAITAAPEQYSAPARAARA